MAITIDHDMIHDYTDFNFAAWLSIVSVRPLKVNGEKTMSDRDRTTKARAFAKEKLTKVLYSSCTARKQYSDPIGRVDAHVCVCVCLCEPKYANFLYFEYDE